MKFYDERIIQAGIEAQESGSDVMLPAHTDGLSAVLDLMKKFKGILTLNVHYIKRDNIK